MAIKYFNTYEKLRTIVTTVGLNNALHLFSSFAFCFPEINVNKALRQNNRCLSFFSKNRPRLFICVFLKLVRRLVLFASPQQKSTVFDPSTCVHPVMSYALIRYPASLNLCFLHCNIDKAYQQRKKKILEYNYDGFKYHWYPACQYFFQSEIELFWKSCVKSLTIWQFF